MSFGRNIRNISSNRYVRKSNPTSIAKLRDELLATDWSVVLRDYDVDSSYDKFLNTFFLMYHNNLPLCKCNSRNRKTTP